MTDLQSPPATRHEATAETMTGAASLVRSLEAAGVEVVFGIPGGAILPAYDPLMDSESVRHVLVRHEQGAGHAAEGYAAATNRVGVCMATSGPGATNLVTAIADAHMDSVPMVAITGQVASGAIGTDAFQEADIRGITMPITKHSFLVTKPDNIAGAVAAAFHIAGTGRPGPVLVDVAIDQGGCFETSHATTHAEPTYVVDGIVHYCVANMPGAVARTSTYALNNVTLPHALRIADLGWREALRANSHLAAGLNVHAGKVTYQAVAEELGYSYASVAEAIAPT